MTDDRTTAQAKTSEDKLILRLTEILVARERELMDCREQLAAARQQLGERAQAHDSM